ncbi:MAG: DNA replication/repair protein RecF [Candidatus Dormibacter sp.]|uniref:DNA replication/repair protein RecF n=1 Tax=Candidatus Dormibacter sp. TaxID=2973982 RepID=UPI000DB0996F|nr:MAG: DNA replication/repair protein RecF [Candidatus Dormibacteraeota bacterium]
MLLKHLELRNYRNYARMELDPGPGLNLFLGANGQGKTNLLEAVALLALSASPRAGRDAELIGELASEARVQAQVESGGRLLEIRIDFVLEGNRTRRRIQVDGQPRRALDLPGIFRVTLFWPDDLDLIKAGPEHRRRLLNQLLVQVRPGYARTLARYARTLEQRNRLLKQIALGEQPEEALDVWDLQLVALGEELRTARAEAVASLAPLASAAHSAISGGELLEISYAGTEQGLAQALAVARREDLRRGVSTVGPHRDDVLVVLEGREARAYASQGQQRSAVVSVKLAEAQVIAELTGEAPVLLLDDVLSELDAERRRELLRRLLEPGQVIVTSVEAEPFPPAMVALARVLCIDRGRLLHCA